MYKNVHGVLHYMNIKIVNGRKGKWDDFFERYIIES